MVGSSVGVSVGGGVGPSIIMRVGRGVIMCKGASVGLSYMGASVGTPPVIVGTSPTTNGSCGTTTTWDRSVRNSNKTIAQYISLALVVYANTSALNKSIH